MYFTLNDFLTILLKINKIMLVFKHDIPITALDTKEYKCEKKIIYFFNFCDRDLNLFLWKVTTLHICRAKCDYPLHVKYTTLWHALIFFSLISNSLPLLFFLHDEQIWTKNQQIDQNIRQTINMLSMCDWRKIRKSFFYVF